MKKEDQSLLMVCAVRYSLGRMTYMPSLVQEIVKSNIKNLTDNDLNVMRRDVKEYIEREEKLCLYSSRLVHSVGDDWYAFGKTLSEEYERRFAECSK